jgi:signal transduction histidine kinase
MCLTLPLSAAGIEASLPICDATLRALEQVLWLTDEVHRASALVDVLRVDPALTCFLVAELLPDSAVSAPSLPRLAALAAPWLAVLLDEKLKSNDSASPSDCSAMVDAVVQAELVKRLAEEHGCAESASYELAALAGGAVSLVQLSLPETPSSANIAQRLSTWLVQEIGLPDVTVFCTVAESLWGNAKPQSQQDPSTADQSSASERPAHASAHLLENCDQLASAVETHHRQTDASAGEDLLRLATRLAPLESLQHEFSRRLETEKLLAMKELAYGAGHEINNPLANISVRAQTLIKQEHDPERRRMLAAINGQVYRAHEMIADLMLFAQPPKLVPSATDLHALVQRTVTGLLSDAARQNSTLLVHPTETLIMVNVDPVQLPLALHAMIINSLEAMGQGGRIELQARLQRAARGEHWAEIRVTDDGPGIADEVRQHLFDPFYSGREAGRGLGFGLSKCWRIVTAHGGRIDVESSPGQGACFTILLPA